MPMAASDLSRRFVLTVCAAGTVHIHKKGAAPEEGTLPVFSTDTHDEATALRVRHCRLARDRSGLYTLNDPPRDVKDLGAVSDLFRGTYEETQRERAGEAKEALRDPKARRAALGVLDRAAKVGE